MTAQLDIFEAPSATLQRRPTASELPAPCSGPVPRFPRARRDDVRSSHEAASEIERTGAADAQMSLVLGALKQWPGSTGRELAKVAMLDYHLVMRRLPELVKDGLVREVQPHDGTVPCAVTGKKLLRRWPV